MEFDKKLFFMFYIENSSDSNIEEIQNYIKINFWTTEVFYEEFISFIRKKFLI